MITPDEIRARVRKLWLAGSWLRALVRNDPIYPYPIPFRRPPAREWLADFASVRAAVEALEAQSKARRGSGYAIHFREVARRALGTQREPERIVIESVDDAAACAGESGALARFRSIDALLREREPRLLAWLAARPLVALEREAAIERLLDVVQHARAHPRPGVFVREFGVPGVDTKFVEAQRTILREWLDLVLTPEAIDQEVAGHADHAFERRYGFRFEEPLVRMRWLDPSRAIGPGVTDATLPLSQLAAYAPGCEHVIVTENKVSFLTLPSCPRAIAIFGAGYAIDHLAAIAWIDRCQLHYWGDIDTHGFAILNRLRRRWPHARSLLMDRATLMAHARWWSEEPADARLDTCLTALDEAENALYRDLCDNRLGMRVRLEQERIGFDWVRTTVQRLFGEGPREILGGA